MTECKHGKKDSCEECYLIPGHFTEEEITYLTENPIDNTDKENKSKEIKILSQDKIDELLDAISSGEEHTEEKEMRKTKIYDFRRPDTLTKDNIICLQMIFETFSFLSKFNFQQQLKTPLVNIYVASVDQLTFEETIRSLPRDEVVSIISPDPYRGAILFAIPSQIINIMIEKLCGGSKTSKSNDGKVSDFELSLLEGIMVRFLGNLREAFFPLTDLRPRLETIETDTRYIMTHNETDMGVLVTMEIRIDDLESMINFFIPQSVLYEMKKEQCLSVAKYRFEKDYDSPKTDFSNIKKTFYHIAEPFNMLMSEVKKIEVGSFLPLENKTQIVWREYERNKF